MTAQQRTVSLIVALVVAAFALGAFLYQKQVRDSQMEKVAQQDGRLVRMHSPVFGPQGAPVTLVEFFDPACETCRAFYPVVKDLLAKYPNDLRLVIRYAPFHQGSDHVVKLLEASKRQNKYTEVLEAVLADLRHDELQHDIGTLSPLEGLLCIFDFVESHFAAHPRLRKLLAFENLNEARHLACSARIPEMASPVLSRIRKLLALGAASGEVRAGVDALHLYVVMVSLSYYGRAHAFTLSRIFHKDLLKPAWQKAHLNMARQMMAAYLAPQ